MFLKQKRANLYTRKDQKRMTMACSRLIFQQACPKLKMHYVKAPLVRFSIHWYI